MNKNLLSGQNHLKWKNTSNQGARRDHCPSSGAVKLRFKESLKDAKYPGADLHLNHSGALGMNSSNESCTIKQTSSGSVATQHYRQ